MKPTIEYQGFEPDIKTGQFVNEGIGNLAQMSPYESYIEVLIVKENEDYKMKITIKYPEGTFTCSTDGLPLEELIAKSIDTVAVQIKTWSKRREFEEPNVLEPLVPHSPLKRFNVLLVDDDIESIIPLEQCLKKLGCVVKIVSTGFEAIHELLSDEQDYNLVFMDWTMPDMNGDQTLLNTQKVISHAPSCKLHWQSEQLPVIMFSGRSKNEIKLPTCRDFNLLDCWEKSISYNSLFEKVSNTYLELTTSAIRT